MPVTARDVKRWIREGRIKPTDGTTVWQPGWRFERPLWRGTVEGFVVEFCPDGPKIDMTTLRVRAIPPDAS